MVDESHKPRVWWVFPGDGQLPPAVIDAPPDIWQDKITASRVAIEYRNKFIKVVEVIPDRLTIVND